MSATRGQERQLLLRSPAVRSRSDLRPSSVALPGSAYSAQYSLPTRARPGNRFRPAFSYDIASLDLANNVARDR